MENSVNPAPAPAPAQVPDPAQLALIQKKLALENKFKSGVNWFYSIAGFSILNSLLSALGQNIAFVVGLGATQLVDAFAYVLVDDLGSDFKYLKTIGYVINLLIAGIFVLMGKLAKKRRRGAIITGMVLYALDAILLILFKDFLGLIFHGLALFGIWGGLKALNLLEELEKDPSVPSLEVINQQLPPPVKTPEQIAESKKRFKIFLFVLGVFMIIPLCIIIISVLVYQFK